MLKVYFYEMSGCTVGTDDTLLIVAEDPLKDEDMGEYAQASSEEVDSPEICFWLEATITTIAELEEHSGDILRGSDTLEELIESLEKEGMIWEA